MDSTVTDDRTTPAVDAPAVTDVPDLYGAAAAPLPAGLLADLDDSHLVLSERYIGTDRRQSGTRAWLRRATFAQRRSLFSLEVAVIAAVAILVAATVLLTSGSKGGQLADRTVAARRAVAPATTPTGAAPSAPATSPATAPPTTTAAPAAAPAATAPSTTAAPAATAPSTTAPPITAAVPVAAPVPAAVGLTPAQLGASALALVRYPWQSIPGYAIQFLPISDAPSAGFYGNTTFTWGHTGGTSILYVYPGETVQQLAGITAFEIAHEVDAAAVEPQGGEAQIEDILGIHPASWAPNCDCAEQDFLSGWYAAAFSNYWSPGVGDWSTVAPEPTGAVLAAIEPWLNPVIS
jgi:hypothetical protein